MEIRYVFVLFLIGTVVGENFKVPEELDEILVRMLIEYKKNETLNTATTGNDNDKSVEEGNAEITKNVTDCVQLQMGEYEVEKMSAFKKALECMATAKKSTVTSMSTVTSEDSLTQTCTKTFLEETEKLKEGHIQNAKHCMENIYKNPPEDETNSTAEYNIYQQTEVGQTEY